MADHRLIGQNYATPDLIAKVTGRARYAEDHLADGMLFCKLLLSPMPHARVVRIDASAALALPGVKAILTAEDMPPVANHGSADTNANVTVLKPEWALTNEPVYEGEPILAVAATSELIAAEAIERIVVDFEPLPFVVDAIESLRPGSPNARLEGNVWAGSEVKTIKWTAQDFADAHDGHLPMGEHTETWAYGDLEDGFKNAALVLEDTFVTQSTGHQPLETRTAMAYWQNGKLYLYGSTQSVAKTVPAVAEWVGIDQSSVVMISEYTGGGFGSKIPGAQCMAIPALLSKKAECQS